MAVYTRVVTTFVAQCILTTRRVVELALTQLHNHGTEYHCQSHK